MIHKSFSQIFCVAAISASLNAGLYWATASYTPVWAGTSIMAFLYFMTCIASQAGE